MTKAEIQAVETMRADLNKVLATHAASPAAGGGAGPRQHTPRGLTPTRAGSPQAAKEGAKFAPGEQEAAGIKPVTAGQAVAQGARKLGSKIKQVASQVAAGARGMKPSLANSIPCPCCGEGMSKAYVVKALGLLAKAEGIDLDDELSQFVDEDEVEKSKKEASVGNKTASHRGAKPGKFHSSSRGKGAGPGVQRKNTPTNPTTEEGMGVSKSFAVTIGQPQLVEYVNGTDEVVAKGIGDGSHHMPSARNMRAEQELATGEATE